MDDIADLSLHKAINAGACTWRLKFPLRSSVGQTARTAADTTRQADQRRGGGETSWTGLRGEGMGRERGRGEIKGIGKQLGSLVSSGRGSD